MKINYVAQTYKLKYEIKSYTLHQYQVYSNR